MFSKIKESIKINWQYYLLSSCMMIITLLIASVNFNSKGTYEVNTPFNSLYGIISYTLIFVVGILGTIIFRNANKSNVKLEKLYLWAAIPIGIIMCILSPLGRIPDEDHHARKAMAISQGNIFSYVDEDGIASDMINSKVNELVTRSTDSYEEAIRRLTLAETDEKVRLSYNTMALYAPICHAPQAIGMLITRLFGCGISIQCYAARLVNFAVAIALIYNAIRYMPYKKYVLMFIALLPVTFNVLPTMSADALTISMSMFYVSYILYLRYDKDVIKISKLSKIILFICTIIISLCKIVYLPLCFLLLLLPKEKMKSKKEKIGFICFAIGLAIILNLIWLVYCTRFLIEFNGGVNSKEQIIYILTNPFEYCIILFRTINFYFHIFIMHLCGDGLGMFCVKASEMFIYPCVVIMTVIFIGNNNEEKIKLDLFTRLVCSFVFIAIAILIFTSIYVQWTPVKEPLIKGIQARYFLPILILTAIMFDNNKIKIEDKLNRLLLIFAVYINLNVATATLFTYYFGMLIDGYVK